MNTPEEDRLQKLLEEHASALAEHFDSVRIFVTTPSDDGESNTKGIETGRGNFYAQLGQVHEWLIVQDQYQRNWATRNEEKEKPE